MSGHADARFLTALDLIPQGHSEGVFADRRWRTTLDRSGDGRCRWLYAEALDGSDHVSFNLFTLASGPALRPCEMPVEKAVAFVLGYAPGPVVGNDRDARRS